MTARMIDCLYPPTTAASLSAIRAATGASVMAVYVPGWGTPLALGAPNPTQICQVALASGWDLHFILDPNHAPLPQPGAILEGCQQAMNWIATLGVNASLEAGVSFDLEEGDWANESLCKELSAAFYEAGTQSKFLPVQYTNSSQLLNLVSLPGNQRVEAVWAAYWNLAAAWPTSTASISGLPDSAWSSPGQRGWQWQGGTSVAGVSVDLSIVDWPTWSAGAAPTPTPSGPIVLLAGQPYQTPRGDIVTIR